MTMTMMRWLRWIVVVLLSSSSCDVIVSAGFSYHDCQNHQSQQPKRNRDIVSRQKILHDIGRTVLISGGLGNTAFSAPPALAIWPFDSKEQRRQLELCIVSLLRVSYWAQSLTAALSSTTYLSKDNNYDDDEDIANRRKQAYLEARLGAKALVTGKVGGGASYRVYTLSKLELRDCLEDMEFWYSQVRKQQAPRRFLFSNTNNDVTTLKDDLIESLASLVEFDGLETTQDPSPRSSLMLTMYSEDKALFVQRMLSERVIPITKELVNCFDADARRTSEAYLIKYHTNEIPALQPSTVEPSLPPTTP